MKSKHSFLAILLLSLAFISCDSQERSAEVTDSKETYPPDMHTSQIALDVDGTYRGILPCADCAGIQTKITLDNEMNFVKRTVYIGKSSEIFTTEGTYSWREDGNTIRFEGINEYEQPAFYHVGENKLFQLDLEGNRISGDLAENYILHKIGDGLQNTYWKLTELRGEEITSNSTREAHIIFHTTDGRVTGNGSCNSFFGTYTVEDGNRLTLSQIASTKMSCENMEIETELLPLLEQVDNFAIGEDGTLSLNRAKMAPLARYSRVF